MKGKSLVSALFHPVFVTWRDRKESNPRTMVLETRRFPIIFTSSRFGGKCWLRSNAYGVKARCASITPICYIAPHFLRCGCALPVTTIPRLATPLCGRAYLLYAFLRGWLRRLESNQRRLVYETSVNTNSPRLMEYQAGFEPAPLAWKTKMLPLHHRYILPIFTATDLAPRMPLIALSPWGSIQRNA